MLLGCLSPPHPLCPPTPFYPCFSKNCKTVVMKHSASSQMDRHDRQDGSLSAKVRLGSTATGIVLASYKLQSLELMRRESGL